NPCSPRLACWTAFVGVIAAVNYAYRFAGGGGNSRGASHPELYSWSFFAGGMVLYTFWLGIVLAICFDRFDLLALRRPRSWGRAGGLGGWGVAGSLAWGEVGGSRGAR